MHDFLQDVGFALRMLRKAPAFTAAALLVLALGIGATSAIFSVVDAVVLRPLPYPESDRVVVVHTDFGSAGLERMPESIPEFRDFREQSRSFENLAVYQLRDANLGGVEPPERLLIASVSPAFFPVVRVEAAAGRTFTPDEEEAGNNHVALLSHALWQRRFGGDPGVVGRSIQLGGIPYTVTGVLPRGFALPGKTDVWISLSTLPVEVSEEGRNWRNWDVIGRLKPGVTVAQAQEEMTGLRQRMAEEHEGAEKGTANMLIEVRTLKELLVGETRTTLLVLLGAVAFVLLIACANVANLLLARTAGNVSDAARALGLSRSALYRRMQHFGLRGAG